jgi:tetratricopeptide (TPR) repeat protein
MRLHRTSCKTIAGNDKTYDTISPDTVARSTNEWQTGSKARMARTVLEVFLSSTAKDLATHREAVHARLAKIDFFHCIRMEDFGAQDAQALAFCREKASAADLFVGLIGMRRGWEPVGDNARRSITEIEHDAARDAGRRRFLWVTPDDFRVAANLRESDALHERQLAFRKRVMDERIVSPNNFDSPDRIAADIVEQLLAHVVTGDLIKLLRPEFASQGRGSLEEQAPAIAAAVEKLAADQDVDLLALAKNPKGIDLTYLEDKLKTRAEAHETAGRNETKISAEYWRHIGALAFLHNTHKALAAYEKAVSLDPDDSEGWCYLGHLQYRLGNLTKAEKMHRTFLKLEETAGDKEGLAIAYGNLGLIYRTRGDLAEAEQMHLKSLGLEREVGHKNGMAADYGNLATIHHIRGDFDKAEDMYLNALKLFEDTGGEGIAIIYGNLGVIYQTRGDFDKAKKMQLKALKLSKELVHKDGMARAYINLGAIYSTLGDLAKAEKMQLKALKLDKELGRKEGMADANWNLSAVYNETGNKTRACECLRKTRDLWREMGLTDKAAEAERLLKERGCDETST